MLKIHPSRPLVPRLFHFDGKRTQVIGRLRLLVSRSALLAMTAREIPSDIANDDKKLKAKASQEFGPEFDESSAEVDSWTYYYTDEVPKHAKDRIIVFKAPEPSSQIRCIRVWDKDDIKKTVWDVVRREGTYIGLVPASYIFDRLN